MTDLLELSGVHVVHRAPGGGLFTRDRVYALTDADLSIAVGETVGVVGESGCGKSTLARVIVGLQKPAAGTISIHGKDVWQLPASQRRQLVGRGVGMIFQDPSTSLNRRMTVRQILRDPLDVHRWRTGAERDKRVDELLELAGLPRSAASVLPAQLSGGQRQRVAIGRALALKPELIVADEPTSALDVSVRAQLLNLLLDLKDRLGIAMVFISHDIQTVRRVADRVVTMYLGRIVEQTPAAAVPGGARHPYTRALFSATPSLLTPVEPIVLTGPVPSAVHPPSGCPFRTRCWRATGECARQLPPVTAEPGTGEPGTGEPGAGGPGAGGPGAGEPGAAGPGAGEHRYRCYHPVLDRADLAEAIEELP